MDFLLKDDKSSYEQMIAVDQDNPRPRGEI